MEFFRNSNSPQLLWLVLLPATNEEDPSNNEGTRVVTTFFPIISIWGFFQTLKAVKGPIWPNFKPIRDFICVLVACKREDPIQNEGDRVVTTFFIDFSDTQGQLTLKSVKKSC